MRPSRKGGPPLGRDERRLAAILAADVAGYSRLMSADESGTLARFNALRSELLDPKIAQFKGRIVGSAGDSLLVEFGSAVDAVQCAVEAQERIAARNADIPEDHRIVFRMGINLGDVIAEGATIHGDGVNVASRLERLAGPGTVVIGRSIHDQVTGKLPYAYADLGEHTVKNIPAPVRAYRVELHVRPAVASLAQAQDLPLPSKPSVAVLPFTNMSGDPEQEYFSDGITEDIITELSRNRGLFVIARNSSFMFKGPAVDIAGVGRKLGVRYVVEGSVRKAGKRVRITAQLIEAGTGSHVWADRYESAVDDVFSIQDEVVRAIVSSIPRMIGEAQVESSKRRPPENLTAYDFVLRGEWHSIHGDTSGNPQALAMFRQALAIDPNCARAHANIAYQFAYDLLLLGTQSEKLLRQARDHVEKALELDSGDATAHETAAFVYLLCEAYDLAERHAGLAVLINPNDRHAVSMRGLVTSCLGDPRLGIEWILKAQRLDPGDFDSGREPLIDAFYMLRDYGKAIDLFRQWRHPPAHILLDVAACYAQLGSVKDARAMVSSFETARPSGFDLAGYVAVHVSFYKHQEDRDHWLEGYRKAGIVV